MPGKVRIGAVSYLNTRPLVFGVEQGLGAARIELTYEVPAVLAEQLARGALDVALLPIIELARIPDLEIVPGLGIVTRGPSRSVLLVSQRPVDQLRSVALDPESRTSNALVQILCDRVWGVSAEFRVVGSSLRRSLEHCDAAVRIGDKALFEPLPEDCVTEDLGEVWSRETGLPFVYAAWIARRGVVDREIYSILHDSRRQGVRVIDAIAEDYSWNGTRYPELAREYLTEHIQFRLGAAEMQGMTTFFRAAAELGLIECVPRVETALRRRTACDEAASPTTQVQGSGQ
jgi:chorismate dehydratase